MTPDELTDWLLTAQRIFSEAFGAGDISLRIIVANARNPRQAVEYRVPSASKATVFKVNETVEVHIKPDETPAQVGNPIIYDPAPQPVELSQDERDVLRVIRHRRLQGKDICRELKRKYNGTSKNLFSRMANVEARKLLTHNSNGYTASALGVASFDAVEKKGGEASGGVMP